MGSGDSLVVDVSISSMPCDRVKLDTIAMQEVPLFYSYALPQVLKSELQQKLKRLSKVILPMPEIDEIKDGMRRICSSSLRPSSSSLFTSVKFATVKARRRKEAELRRVKLSGLSVASPCKDATFCK